MVRLGTLPLRLLAIERGAEIVYSEEIVAAKLAKAERRVNERLAMVDWWNGGGIVLRTCEQERGRLVVQIGTSDVHEAVAAVAALRFDPADPLRDGIIGVDINMGCPKRSAVAGGSGGALFADAARAEAIVRALRAVLPERVALSCKVRLHADGAQETLRRCRRLVASGAAAVAIHARTASERSRDLARWGELALVAAALREHGTRVIVNGDALDRVAASALAAAAPGCDVMVGRGALHAGNGLFAAVGSGVSEGGLAGRPCDEIEDEDDEALDAATLAMCIRYAQIAIDVENPPQNTAFVLQWMLHARMRERRHAPCIPTGVPPTTGGGAGGTITVEAAAKALCGASSMGGIASALGLEGHLNAKARGTPAAPTHRYTPGYFEGPVHAMSDWAQAPSRQALRQGHAAMDAHPRTNDDFRRLVHARAALAAESGGPSARTASSSSGGSSSQPAEQQQQQHHHHHHHHHHQHQLLLPAHVPAPATGRTPRAAEEQPEEQKLPQPPPLPLPLPQRVQQHPHLPDVAGARQHRAGACTGTTAPSAAADPRAALVEAVGPAIPVRYFVLEEAPPAAKALGYFAAAWRCRAVLGGRSFDGGFRRSRHCAEQAAAQVALDGLAACPLGGREKRRAHVRAKRDAKKRRRGTAAAEEG